MSSTQQFSTISTGLREVEAQMGSLRGLNGTLVSALTADDSPVAHAPVYQSSDMNSELRGVCFPICLFPSPFGDI